MPQDEETSTREGSPTRPWAVGIDIVDIFEIEEALTLFGEHYLRRVYTVRERQALVAGAARQTVVRRLAACFAVKEATLKALAPEDDAVGWSCIDVQPEATDGRLVVLSGAGAALAERRGIARLSGSVDVRRTFATAVVFGERSHSEGT